MATGVPGRLEYTGSQEAVWCSLDGGAMVRVEIRRSDSEAILFSPQQARELGELLMELANECKGYRIVDGEESTRAVQ
jgi:hypothetical protein